MFELYLITPELSPSVLLSRSLRALEGAAAGRVALQLRTKHLSRAQTSELAASLREPTRRAGVPLIINQDVDVARACGADGVQLPELGPGVREARAALDGAWIGRSCHDAAGLRRAAEDGADFATLAPVFDVPAKGPPIGLLGLSQLTAAARIPVFALGGITPARIPGVRDAGAAGIAVVRGIFDAVDPARAVRDCLCALDGR